mmetsp:Transcript_1355/g.2079  ORF Transcript_1355/g.2079 Transcript_1355/m.2079 type:complete len:92 (+) Transcript_1355:615-890(+)
MTSVGSGRSSLLSLLLLLLLLLFIMYTIPSMIGPFFLFLDGKVDDEGNEGVVDAIDDAWDWGDCKSNPVGGLICGRSSVGSDSPLLRLSGS